MERSGAARSHGTLAAAGRDLARALCFLPDILVAVAVNANVLCVFTCRESGAAALGDQKCVREKCQEAPKTHWDGLWVSLAWLALGSVEFAVGS